MRIQEANPDYETCEKCVHSDDSEEICVLRRCIHAISSLKECFEPTHPMLYGYPVEHLALIALVLQKGNLSPYRVAEILKDVSRFVNIGYDKIEETQ